MDKDSAFAEPLAQLRRDLQHMPFPTTEDEVARDARITAALDLIEQRAAEMERALRELVDAVRILDVMLREPAAKGLMSAEDYRSYLSGAWLGVDEKTSAARAVLSTRKEQK